MYAAALYFVEEVQNKFLNVTAKLEFHTDPEDAEMGNDEAYPCVVVYNLRKDQYKAVKKLLREVRREKSHPNNDHFAFQVYAFRKEHGEKYNMSSQ